METRVRYVVTGVFALTALLGGILFVLWLQNVGDLRGRRELLLHFNGPAAGLRAGAPVTFNGIRVGEVTRIAFDPARPNDVIAHLSIQSNAPVSSDTQADLDTQGIVGNVQVSLRGGSPEQRLRWRGPNPPTIEAKPSRTLTEDARETLADLRAVLSDNAAPLKSAIANIDGFTGALARNADKVDGILAGLEKMTGGSKADAARMFDLAAPSLPALPPTREMQLAIADPSALVMFDTQKLLVVDDNGEISPAGLQWSDSIPKLVQRKLTQALDGAGLRYASAGADAAMPDATLQTEIRAFQILRAAQPRAEIALSMRIAGNDGRILDARLFRAEAPAAATDGPEAAEAMNAAFAKVLKEAAPWIAETAGKIGPAQADAPDASADTGKGDEARP